VPYRIGSILHASKCTRTRRVLERVSEVRYFAGLPQLVVRQVQHNAHSAARTLPFFGVRGIRFVFSIIFVFPAAETADFVYIHFGEAFNFLFLFCFFSHIDNCHCRIDIAIQSPLVGRRMLRRVHAVRPLYTFSCRTGCASFGTSGQRKSYEDTISNLKIGKDTRVIFQGFTGRPDHITLPSFEITRLTVTL
jgi:hypothetical protein